MKFHSAEDSSPTLPSPRPDAYQSSFLFELTKTDEKMTSRPYESALPPAQFGASALIL